MYKGLTLYFNLLQNAILLWVKMCLKNSYLKRNVKLDLKDKASQEELDRVLILSAKNMVIFSIKYKRSLIISR